ALDIPLSHHERWDGSGYPRGLAGEAIPLPARLFAIADAFDALISDRPYHGGISVEDALKELDQSSGTHFDPHLVREFISFIREKHP
ncbi:MAG: HD domain-containing protein, partial [Rectinema sp.]|nr:HD domain-containing protein [Rectinema sp.]